MPADLPDRVCTLVTAHLDCADRFARDASLRDLKAVQERM